MAGDGHGEDDRARYLVAATNLGRALFAPLSELAIDPTTWAEPVKAQFLLQSMSSLLLPLDTKYNRAVVEWSDTRAAATKRKARRSRKRGEKAKASRR